MLIISGIAANDWWKLLRQNNFRIDPPYWHKAILLTIRSFFNSKYRQQENKIYGSKIQDTPIEKPPIFILGHWRSGTTLLHNLLALDKQFCFPNLFQVYNPHAFLLLESIIGNRLAEVKPQKRLTDNMEVSFAHPADDEFALAILSLRSPLLNWSFPRRMQFYDRFLTFRDVPGKEIDQWKVAFLLFSKKLTYRYHRQIIFKSPAHTCRIKLLLEMFPDARFIHIHRNPYTVFLSTRKLYETAIPGSYLQKPNQKIITEGIFKRYAEMSDAFFEEKKLIPQGHYAEICFEEFESDLMGTLRQLYNSLSLDGFPALKPVFQTYTDSISNYKKNEHPILDVSQRTQIADRWRRSFKEWGYEV